MKIEVDAELHLLVKDAVRAIFVSYYNANLIRQIEGHLCVVFRTGEKAEIVIEETIVVDDVAPETSVLYLNPEIQNRISATDRRTSSRKRTISKRLLDPAFETNRGDDLADGGPSSPVSLKPWFENTRVVSQQIDHIVSLLRRRKITNNKRVNEDAEMKQGDTKMKQGDTKMKQGDTKMKQGDTKTKQGETKTKQGDTKMKQGDTKMLKLVANETRKSKSVANKAKKKAKSPPENKMKIRETDDRDEEGRSTEVLQNEDDDTSRRSFFDCSTRGKPFDEEVGLKRHVISQHGRQRSPRALDEIESKRSGCSDFVHKTEKLDADAKATDDIINGHGEGRAESRGHRRSSYGCSTCGKRFDTEISLKHHFVSKHRRSGVKARHLRSGGGGGILSRKPRCHLCKASFSTKNWLRIHQLRFHRESGRSGVAETIISGGLDESDVQRDTNVVQNQDLIDGIEFDAVDSSKHDSFDVKASKIKKTDDNFKKNAALLHIGPPEILCSYCEKPFWSKFGLLNHFNRFHKGQEMPESSVDVENVKSDVGVYSTEKRPTTTTTIDAEEPSSVYFCPECRNRYSNKRSLKQHMKNNHGYVLEAVDAQFERIVGETNGSSGKTYECTFCKNNYRYKDKKTFMHHMLKFHACDSSVAGSSPNEKPDARRVAAAADDGKKLVKAFVECSVCRERLARRKDLVYHKAKYHTTQRCDYCQLDFVGYVGLNEHARERHAGVDLLKRFICEFCSKGFRASKLLREHVEAKHLGVVFPCGVCDKVLSCFDSLRNHRRLHDSERHRTCDVCGERFARFQGFLSHLRRSHPERVPDEYRVSYECGDCGKAFALRSRMMRHVKTKHENEPQTCEFCEKVLGCRRYLLRHLRTHHGDVQLLRAAASSPVIPPN